MKIPEKQEDLLEVLANDSTEELLKTYKMIRSSVNGRTISDISLVWEQLTDWETPDRVELIIPYNFSPKRKEPIGHRIWYLSRQKSSPYYYGAFFDLQQTKTKKPSIRKCKLSPYAIQLFQNHPEIKENL